MVVLAVVVVVVVVVVAAVVAVAEVVVEVVVVVVIVMTWTFLQIRRESRVSCMSIKSSPPVGRDACMNSHVYAQKPATTKSKFHSFFCF